MNPLIKRANTTSALTRVQMDGNWTAIEEAIGAINQPGFVVSNLGFTPLSASGMAADSALFGNESPSFYLSTSNMNEGNNLFFTTARVLSTQLTGLSVTAGGAVVAGDTILSAMGKFENRMAVNDLKASYPGPPTFAAVTGKPTTLSGYGITDGLSNPMTAEWDMIVGGVGGVPTRLPKGANGTYPLMVGGQIVWTAGGGGMTNPMTTLGDIIVAGGSGVPERRAKGAEGTLWGVNAGAPGYYTPATFGINAAGQGFTVITGMDPTGATDSSAAIASAIAALPTGGGVLLMPDPKGQGGYKFNITINRSGVWILGPGLSDNSGINYCRPWNTALPMVKFGTTAGDTMVRHSGIRDMYLYGGNTGKSGIVFGSGANYCRVQNCNIRNFTSAHITFINDTDLQPTQFNIVDHFSIESSATIADNGGTDYPIGILSEDRHVSGDGWTTANYVSNGNINVGNGYPYVVESAALSLTNVYIDQGATHGAVIKWNYYYEPFLTTTNVISDTNGTGSVGLILDFGYDLQSHTSTKHISFMGGLLPDLSLGDDVFYAAGHTTGTITSGQSTLTLASMTGVYSDRGIIVKGAGVGGLNLYADILGISGSVVTLSVAASTSVTNADVMYGDSTGEKAFIGYGGNAYIAPGGIRLIPTGKKGVAARGEKGQFFRCGASGGAPPFNSTDFAFDFKNGSGIHFLHDITGGTSVASVTQSGTTVTVNTGSSHGAMVGDLVTMWGVREMGINGTFAIATVPSATSVTYVSPISQTLAGVTGSVNAIFTNSVRIVGGQVVLSGYAGMAMKNQLGNVTKVFYQSSTNGAMYIQTSDPTNGSFSMIAGTGIGTGTAYAWQANNTTKMRLLGDATLQLKPGAAPANDASYGQFYYSSVDSRWHIKDIANNDGAILSKSRGLTTNTTASPTSTASTTAVMMGCAGTITPTQTGRIKVIISGQMKNSVAGSGVVVDLRYGSGTKPANGAAVTGTVIGIEQPFTSVSAGQSTGFTIVGHVDGLTLATAYWLDASVRAVTSGNASINNINICAEEV